MKNISILILISACIACTFSTQAQSIKKLDENNGFKKYKLGSRYQSVYGIKNKQEDGSFKVVIGYVPDKIGNIPVKTIELVYLKDTLAKIIVTISPEYNPQLLEGVKNSFGSPTQDLSDNETTRKSKDKETRTGSSDLNRYVWKTKKINLEYFYSYPKFVGDSYSSKDLHLMYALNDYSARLERSKKGTTSAKDF
jgi:hypothetical protein